MKHSQFDSFSYNDFSKQEIYNMLVELQDELIKTKKEHINDVKALALEKKKNQALEIEREVLKEKEKNFSIKKRKSKPIADFKRKDSFNKKKVKKKTLPPHRHSHKIGEDLYSKNGYSSHYFDTVDSSFFDVDM